MTKFFYLPLTDIDECNVDRETCTNGQCINSQGSFRCECPQGFVLGRDGRTCLGNLRVNSHQAIAKANTKCSFDVFLRR